MGNMGIAPGWRLAQWVEPGFRNGCPWLLIASASLLDMEPSLQLLVGSGVLTRSMNDWLFHVVIGFWDGAATAGK